MVVRGGRVVRTPGRAHPYKVVLDQDGGGISEHEVGSVREGEALIRERSAAAAKPERLREWNPLG